MLVYSIVGAAVGIVGTLVFMNYAKGELGAGKRIGIYVLWAFGLLAIGFGVDWAYACTLEVEPQSAAMGLIMFGGIGAVLCVIGYRVGRAKPEKKDSTVVVEAETEAGTAAEAGTV